MPSEDYPRVPFDEQAALEHLERLKHDLEESRRRRKDASAAFDTFVSSFRKNPAGRVDPPPQRLDPRPPSRFDSAAALPISPRTLRKPRPMGILAGGIIAIAAGVVLTRVWRGSPPEASYRPPAVQVPLGSAAGPSGQNTPANTRSELVVVRDVWVRATVDGARVIEQELEAGARVPLRGRTIVIRAGNGGAVRVVIDGQDRGTLGAEGDVVTRTYTASAGR